MVSQSNGGSSVAGSNGKPKNNSSQVSIQAVADSPLLFLLFKIFMYGFGLFNWCFFLIRGLLSGTYFTKPTEQDDNKLAIARDAFWNLSKQPTPGFRHRFFKTRSGFQFHYLYNRAETDHVGDLVFLVHGYPNTSMVWRYMLKEPTLPIENATFIVVDMPGYGGSDSLKKYDTQVLELMTEFIVSMREAYKIDGNSAGSTLIVGHDWGCVVIMRLAAEAPCLADRWIMTNGPLMGLVKANIDRAVSSSQMIFRQFKASPLQNFACLGKSFRAIRPLLWQMFLSGYIFVFQLPSIFVKYLFTGGNLCFLRAVCEAEHGTSLDEFKLQESLGASLGPSTVECGTSTDQGQRYGSTVAERSKSVGELSWQTTAYYRDGLSVSPWDKSIETVAALYNIDSDMSSSESPSRRRSSASASSALFNDQFKGSLRAPSTIIWGEDDMALSRSICLDGIADYIARESEVILLPKVRHWTPIERRSRMILAQIIRMFVTGDSSSTPTYIAKRVQEIDPGATLVAKK